MSNEVKAVLFSLFIQAIVIFLAWLRLRLKRGDTTAEADKLALRYELITLESYESLKKEHEALATLLPKLEIKLEKLRTQVETLQGIEREKAIALGKIEVIESIAERLSINLSLDKKEM